NHLRHSKTDRNLKTIAVVYNLALFYRRASPQDRLARVRQARARMDDRKLVAAVASHHVGLPHRAAEHLRHIPQHFVAGPMSVRIIEFLESVDVDDRQREGAALAAEFRA